MQSREFDEIARQHKRSYASGQIPHGVQYSKLCYQVYWSISFSPPPLPRSDALDALE